MQNCTFSYYKCIINLHQSFVIGFYVMNYQQSVVGAGKWEQNFLGMHLTHLEVKNKRAEKSYDKRPWKHGATILQCFYSRKTTHVEINTTA